MNSLRNKRALSSESERGYRYRSLQSTYSGRPFGTIPEILGCRRGPEVAEDTRVGIV